MCMSLLNGITFDSGNELCIQCDHCHTIVRAQASTSMPLGFNHKSVYVNNPRHCFFSLCAEREDLFFQAPGVSVLCVGDPLPSSPAGRAAHANEGQLGRGQQRVPKGKLGQQDEL